MRAFLQYYLFYQIKFTMQQIKYLLSCILIPLQGLMNFGKHMSISEEKQGSTDDEYEQ